MDYCEGLPTCMGAQVVIDYVYTCIIDPMPAGTYTVQFTEQHVNRHDPLPTLTRFAAFTVTTPVTATSRRSWGSLKSIYR